MKKNLLFSILAVFLSLGVQAQEFGFGAKAGLNFASFSGSDADNFNFEGRTGFHLGLVLELPLAEDFSVQPEVLYSTLGGNTNEFEFEQATDLEFKVDYISIPVMFKYYIIEGLNIEAGPQFSFNTKSDVTGDNFENDDVLNEFEDETNSFDFGGAFGVAYNLPYGLFAQARYVVGFSKIYSNANVNGDDELDLKNNLFQLSAGLKF